jgi:hypothetical protein
MPNDCNQETRKNLHRLIQGSSARISGRNKQLDSEVDVDIWSEKCFKASRNYLG